MRSKALLLAAVTLGVLAFASPAVARPSVHSVIYPHTLSGTAMITVVCLALAVAVALVTGVVLASRPRTQANTERTMSEQLQASRVKKAPSRRQAVV
jgi:hypothetical protein